MQLFENTVKLRGFLGKDAEAPSSDRIQEDSFAVLLLATVSGVWDLSNNQWNPRTDWHRVVCPGPFFCAVVVAGESHSVSKINDTVYAIRIQRLDRPDALVDFGEDG